MSSPWQPCDLYTSSPLISFSNVAVGCLFYNALNNLVMWKREELSNWHILNHYHWITHNQTFILSFWKCEKRYFTGFKSETTSISIKFRSKNERKKNLVVCSTLLYGFKNKCLYIHIHTTQWYTQMVQNNIQFIYIFYTCYYNYIEAMVLDITKKKIALTRRKVDLYYLDCHPKQGLAVD